MPVELSDQDYSALSRLAEFTQKLAVNPKTRRGFEKLAKEIDSSIQTTDDIAAEAAEPYIAELKETREKLDNFLTSQAERETKAAEERADRDRDEAFARLREQRGYTDDGIDAITQLMVKRNIADPEAAAALYDRQNPPIETGPSAWAPDNWNIRERAVDNDVEGLFRNEDDWGDETAAKVLNEMRQAARAA